MPVRTGHSLLANFIAKAAITHSGEKILTDQTQPYKAHPSRITTWNRQFIEQTATMFRKDPKGPSAIDLKELHVTNGQLTI